MKKYRWIIMLSIAIGSALGGVSVNADWWSDYFVPCWREEVKTSSITCIKSFYICPSDYKPGYPPPPLKCPAR
jgi:hypothetical protein